MKSSTCYTVLLFTIMIPRIKNGTMSVRHVFASALVALVVLTGCFNRPVREKDRPLLVTMADLAAFGAPTMDYEQYETLKRVVYLDGSYEINYTFDAPQELLEQGGAYLSVTIDMENSIDEAKDTYHGARAVYGEEGEFRRMDLVEDPDCLRYGEEWFCGILMNEGTPVGHYFTMRTGRKIYTIALSGLYVDKAAAWSGLLLPRLEYLASSWP